MFVLYSTAALSPSSLVIDSKFRWFIRSIVSSLFKDSLTYCHTPPLATCSLRTIRHAIYHCDYIEDPPWPESGTSLTYSGSENFREVEEICYTLGARGCLDLSEGKLSGGHWGVGSEAMVKYNVPIQHLLLLLFILFTVSFHCIKVAIWMELKFRTLHPHHPRF